MKNDIRTDTGKTCDFCKRPMLGDTGKVECLLKKGNLQETVIFNRCCKCYNQKRPLMSRIWRWAVVGVLTFVVLLLTFVLPNVFGWSLSFSPVFLAAFVNIFLKGAILVISYIFLVRFMGLGCKDYRLEVKKHKVIKTLVNKGYSLVDTKAIVD